MTLRTIRELLAEHPLFARFDGATLDELAGCARTEQFDSGALVLREGETADKVFLLRAGDVAVEMATPGQPPMIMETLHPGDLLGVSWLVAPYRHMADARALSNVRALSLDAACLREKCDAIPAVGYAFFRAWAPHVAQRMRAQRMRLLDLYGSGG
ncbi:CRP/FNR family cyclic AMP-dependent transcriptional regulator [Rhodovulum iodosum]|uniref:CRP/FNR family cyclic AMP-dependent transcriptional regulator n=1 Tax=Rhodovulum iodosum TaxID=68291 RepID=A0ABV3XVF0_9RHOB|nr:cyclic nucleotide-binding domain-containing protein [Rhodovulum robiginosum]RSK32205.1 cyclic nucleotide-binding domain-containing protein [Rhodovulum robiginosum]